MCACDATGDDGEPHEGEEEGDVEVVVVHCADSEEEEERCGWYGNDE